MNKRIWIWIVFIALFPPLIVVPLIQYFFYFPVRDGVISGSRVRFYGWASFILGLTAFASIPMSLDKKIDFIKVYKYLSDPTNSSTFILLTFLLQILSIFLLYYSTRNEPEQKQFLPVRKFSPDKLFFICLALAFFPYISYFSLKTLSLDDIMHPSAYSLGIAFINKNYISAFISFLSISILTAIIEESFFRGIILRDYFNVDKKRKYLLLFLAALYFAYVHMPISFIFPFIFALFINRVRLAYNNLLPGIILHAVWNANIIILICMSLNPNDPIHVQRTTTEEVVTISQVWNQKDLGVAKKLFPKYKIDKTLHIFKGIHSTLMIGVYNSSEIIFLQALVKKQSQKDIEKIFYSKDWESNKGKANNLRCSKKHDLCVEKGRDSVLLLFEYNKYAN